MNEPELIHDNVSTLLAHEADEIQPPPVRPAPPSGDRLIPSDEIERALGLTLQAALDLNSWTGANSLEEMIASVEDFVSVSVAKESDLRSDIRRYVLGELRKFHDPPPGAGIYPVSTDRLRQARRNLLLPGHVTGVDGASTGHDGLAATLVSIGVSLVRYDGALNTWKTTFLRHDYSVQDGNIVEQIRQVLDRRGQRHDLSRGRDRLSYLLRRGFMAAAERKALLERTSARWRMGHGTPAPLELLTGSGCMALIDDTLPVLERLLLDEKRWVFIPSGLSSPALSTLAGALKPGEEIGVFQKAKASLEAMVEAGDYDPRYKRRVREFAQRAGDVIVIGGFRATPHAPGQLFLAHAEHAVTAGLIAMADAALQPFRGVPLLLDLAGLSARVGLGADVFQRVVQSAYAHAGSQELFDNSDEV